MKQRQLYSLLGGYAVIILGLTSCGSGQPTKNTASPTVVRIDRNTEPLAADTVAAIFTSPSYVVLKGALLGDPKRILRWDDKYVIHDRKQNRVYLFDTTGQLIRQVGQQGKGPREYIQVSGTAIHNDQLVLYADRPSKLMFFDRQGEFLNEKPLGNEYCFTEGIVSGGDGCLYGVMTGNRGDNGHTAFRIQDDGIVPLLPYEQWPASVTGGTVMTAADKGTIWLSRPFDYNIYRIDPETNEPESAFRLDFGSGNMPERYAEGVDDFDLIMRANKEKIVLHCAKPCQVGRYLLLSTMPDYWLLDTDNGTVRKIGDIPADGGANVHARNYFPIEYQTDRIAITIDPLRTEDAIEKGEIARTPVLDSLLKANSEFQNPILVVYTIAQK